jgi:hypothetical protein
VLVLGKYFQPSLYLWVKPGAHPRVEYLKATSLGQALAFLTNIDVLFLTKPSLKYFTWVGLVGKACKGAYYEHLEITDVKSFITLDPN